MAIHYDIWFANVVQFLQSVSCTVVGGVRADNVPVEDMSYYSLILNIISMKIYQLKQTFISSVQCHIEGEHIQLQPTENRKHTPDTSNTRHIVTQVVTCHLLKSSREQLKVGLVVHVRGFIPGAVRKKLILTGKKSI